jgi:hypothetical protein
MKCIIAIGRYRWALLDHPEETEENRESIQALRDEEGEQNLEINLPTGVYQIELFTDINNGELAWQDEKMIQNVPAREGD